tara:strand:- start:19291 stop:19533 length:243 start_codon:yes stop_codon:yes gene_type:complete
MKSAHTKKPILVVWDKSLLNQKKEMEIVMGKEFNRFKESQNKENRLPVTSFTKRDGTAGMRSKDLPSREPRGVYDPSRGF